MKIMIVDDSKGMRELIRTVLWEQDIEFLECTEGGEAVRQYDKFKPDWVLMDLSMEGMDGITAISEIKGKDPAARIVIVTDYNDKPLRQYTEKFGVEAYVLKENLAEIRVIFRL
ncbi:MAG TPA: response regulator transcription factor [Bacteroidota bacterium]|nr:response regulator transcription factor [Bacteroidota bacterium]